MRALAWIAVAGLTACCSTGGGDGATAGGGGEPGAGAGEASAGELETPATVASDESAGEASGGGDVAIPDHPADLVLDASSQVAGDDPVGGDADLRAEVWLDWSTAGLDVIARVQDDAWLPAGEGADDARRIRSDHLELWLSFDEPELPPIEYVNQFGPQAVPDEAACGDVQGERETCAAWLEQQRAHRRTLTQWFHRQFLLDDGRALTLADRMGDEAAGARSRVEVVDGGWVLEARIPPGLWPPTRQPEITTARVLVDLVDNDAGHERQESFLSSATGREFGVPATWNAVAIDPPLRFPAGVGFELLDHEPGVGWFYEPSAKVTALRRFENEALGYQYAPELPSPDVISLPLPDQPTAEADNNTAAFAIDEPTRGALVLCRAASGGVVLPPHWLEGMGERHAIERDGSTHLVILGDGLTSWLGTGVCGACPTVYGAAYRLDPTGCTETARFHLGSAPDGWSIGRATTPDQTAWGFRSRRGLDDEDVEYETRYLVWDPALPGFAMTDEAPAGLSAWTGEDD